MKQALSILLVLALLAICFTACSESPAETKTDAIENKIVSSNPASLSVSTSQQKGETASPHSMQSDVYSADSLPIVSNTSPNTIQEQNDYQTDEVSQLPVFTSIQQMETFFKNGKAKNDVEAQILNSIGQQQTYYAPVHSDGWKIQKIELVGNETIHYFYDFDNIVNTGTFGCDLLVSVFGSDSLGLNASHFDFMKNKQGSHSLVIGGIEYVYCINTDGSYGIVWKQDSLYHIASLNSHTDQIEEILPLLKVERVSLQTNSDHVTQ